MSNTDRALLRRRIDQRRRRGGPRKKGAEILSIFHTYMKVPQQPGVPINMASFVSNILEPAIITPTGIIPVSNIGTRTPAPARITAPSKTENDSTSFLRRTQSSAVPPTELPPERLIYNPNMNYGPGIQVPVPVPVPVPPPQPYVPVPVPVPLPPPQITSSGAATQIPSYLTGRVFAPQEPVQPKMPRIPGFNSKSSSDRYNVSASKAVETKLPPPSMSAYMASSSSAAPVNQSVSVPALPPLKGSNKKIRKSKSKTGGKKKKRVESDEEDEEDDDDEGEEEEDKKKKKGKKKSKKADSDESEEEFNSDFQESESEGDEGEDEDEDEGEGDEGEDEDEEVGDLEQESERAKKNLQKDKDVKDK